MAACECWQLEHVADDVAASGWYDALTTRPLSEVAGARLSAFGYGRVPQLRSRVKAARYRVRERRFSPPWALVASGEFAPRPSRRGRRVCARGVRPGTGTGWRCVGARTSARVVSRRARHGVVAVRSRPSGRPCRVRPVVSRVRPGGRSLTRAPFLHCAQRARAVQNIRLAGSRPMVL